MFSKPNITRPFTHDERDRQIRYEQNIFDTLCKEIPIPLAKVPKIPSNATYEQTLLAIDEYMHDLISCYSYATQNRLKETCFDDPKIMISWHPDLVIRRKDGKEAAGEMRATVFGIDAPPSEQRVEFYVRLGSMFKEAPLLRKLILIHEAVCHLGQEIEIFALSKRTSHSSEAIKTFLDIRDSKADRLFEEMTAARVEGAIWKAVPISAIKAEIKTISDPEIQDYLWGHAVAHLADNYLEITTLAHREEGQDVTPFEINRMKKIPGVRAFDRRATRPSRQKAKLTTRQNSRS